MTSKEDRIYAKPKGTKEEKKILLKKGWAGGPKAPPSVVAT